MASRGPNARGELRSTADLGTRVSGSSQEGSYGENMVDDTPHAEQREWLGDGLLPRPRTLTAREQEVLKLLAEGRTVRSAADILGLSAKTVDAHKFNLMRKLGVHNKAELVMWAIQKRVVKLPASN